ncbi:hypothetical protein K9M74_04235 [Candidatus Woesearchaeota archaeon]|nr:hypothetical protein [Candidatus Woesearchaeota archaeon]
MKLLVIVSFLLLVISLTACDLIPLNNQIEDISLNPESYLNQTVKITGRLSYPEPMRLYDLGITKKLTDSNGFSIEIKPDVINELYDRKEYVAEGVIKSVDVCKCEYHSPHLYDEDIKSKVTDTNKTVKCISESSPLF